MAASMPVLRALLRPPLAWRDEPEARVALGELLGDRGAAVGGAVVDHHDLEVGDRLARRSTPGSRRGSARRCRSGRRR